MRAGQVDAVRVSSGLHHFLLFLYGRTSSLLPRSSVVTLFLPPPNFPPSQLSATRDTGVLSRGTGITELLCGSNHGAVVSRGKSLRKSSCYQQEQNACSAPLLCTTLLSAQRVPG